MDIKDTSVLQAHSLIRFMAAIGYEPVYHQLALNDADIIAFYQPKFKGKTNISVNTAIKMHNEMAEDTFTKIRLTPQTEFKEYISQFHNEDDFIIMFAGCCKIVERVKAYFDKKEKRFIIQSHKVKFMTKRDEINFSHLMDN